MVRLQRDPVGSTGPAGIVLILNASASSTAADLTLDVTDTQPKTFALPIRMRAGAATVARYAL